MPKNKPNTVEIDETFGMMMGSAVRYALGRQTYIVSTTVGYITLLLPRLDNHTVACMERDIREAPSYGSDTIDKPEWMRLLSALQEEMKKRNIKPW
jgi:hypothetical protein